MVPKQLYRKLPSPQLQLKLFPPWGSELEPQLFKEMRHKILLLLGRLTTCEVLKTPFEPWKKGSEAVQSHLSKGHPHAVLTSDCGWKDWVVKSEIIQHAKSILKANKSASCDYINPLHAPVHWKEPSCVFHTLVWCKETCSLNTSHSFNICSLESAFLYNQN